MVKKEIWKLLSIFLLSVGLLTISSCMSLIGEPTYIQPVAPSPEIEAEPADVEEIYLVGQIGLAGGLVFFDKGSYSNGWRYLEVAPTRWSGSLHDPKAQWGAYPFNINGAVLKNGLGDGLDNSENIVIYNQHLQANHETYEQLPDSHKVFLPSHDGSVAAQLALDAIINDFDDWYLPSQEELLLVRDVLYISDLGSFQGDMYWTSSMSDDRSGTKVNFWNGSVGGSYTDYSYYVRPIRRF